MSVLGAPGPETLLVQHVAYSMPSMAGGLARVVSAGEGADPGLDGRLVVIPALRSCGACLPCRRGHAALCRKLATTTPSATEEHVLARLAVALEPDGTPARRGALTAPAEPLLLAALADVGLLAYVAVIRASVEPNRAAIVLGRGPLATFVAGLVEHRGAAPIRVRDESDEAGIERALEARGIDPFGVPLIDASGGPVARAVALARPGSLVVLARSGGASMIDGATLAAGGLAVVGVGGAHPDLLTELVAFVCAGTLSLASLVRVVEAPVVTAGDDERAIVFAPPR